MACLRLAGIFPVVKFNVLSSGRPFGSQVFISSVRVTAECPSSYRSVINRLVEHYDNRKDFLVAEDCTVKAPLAKSGGAF